MKEIELKTINIQRKNRQCVTIMQLRITTKNATPNGSAGSTEIWCVDGLINFEEPFSGLEELSFNPVSYSVKTDHVQRVQ